MEQKTDPKAHKETGVHMTISQRVMDSHIISEDDNPLQDTSTPIDTTVEELITTSPTPGPSPQKINTKTSTKDYEINQETPYLRYNNQHVISDDRLNHRYITRYSHGYANAITSIRRAE